VLDSGIQQTSESRELRRQLLWNDTTAHTTQHKTRLTANVRECRWSF